MIHRFWGGDHPDLYDILCRATDPDRRILDAIGRLVPLQGAKVIDIGAGTGKYTRLLAPLVSHLLAVEPDRRLVALLRERTRELSNVTVHQGRAQHLSVAADEYDGALAFWAYFFGRGQEGLAEVERAVRPGGWQVVVQNYGNDQFSELWGEEDWECALWPRWFLSHGFTLEVVETDWRFAREDEAVALLGFLYGERGARFAQENWREFHFRAAVHWRYIG